MQHESGPVLRLLPQGAFVVQFHTDAAIDAGQVAGRVEHIVSGQAVVFHSLEALLTFMAQVLCEVRQMPPEQDT
jgi:hypothetical protein